MTKKKEITTRLIEEEYMIHNDDEDDELYHYKDALRYALTPFQRKIYLTYVESGTYASTAKLFKVSTPTCQKYIEDLKLKITEYINNHI